MKVAIIGSGETPNPEIVDKVRDIGKSLALGKHTIITGACLGYPHVAALAALEAGGTVIGYVAGRTLEDHEQYFELDLSKYSELIFQKDYLGKAFSLSDLYLRSLKLCFDADAAVVIGGRAGTLCELTMLASMGRNIYVLKNSGGITSRTLEGFLDEDQKNTSKIEFFDSVEELEMLMKS